MTKLHFHFRTWPLPSLLPLFYYLWGFLLVVQERVYLYLKDDKKSRKVRWKWHKSSNTKGSPE